MKIEATAISVPADGLLALGEVELNGANRGLLEAAMSTCGGSRVWRHRKRAEARDLLALSQLAPRFVVQTLDLRESLRAVALLRVPVPCLPDPRGQLRLASHALLGIRYPQEAIRQPMPGPAFVQLLAPANAWHPNVSPPPQQLVCLGSMLPAGVLAKELVLLTYGGLSMQTVTTDERDPARVFNSAAARWWQRNFDKIPLTEAAFLSPDD